jgi:hypothetical protein
MEVKPERLLKLPKWAQCYIEDLQCEIRRLENEYDDLDARYCDYEKYH